MIEIEVLIWENWIVIFKYSNMIFRISSTYVEQHGRKRLVSLINFNRYAVYLQDRY